MLAQWRTVLVKRHRRGKAHLPGVLRVLDEKGEPVLAI